MANQNEQGDMAFKELRKQFEVNILLRYNWAPLKRAIKQGKCYLVVNADRIDVSEFKDASGHPHQKDNVERFVMSPSAALGGEIYFIACRNRDDAQELWKAGRKFDNNIHLVTIKHLDSANTEKRPVMGTPKRKNACRP